MVGVALASLKVDGDSPTTAKGSVCAVAGVVMRNDTVSVWPLCR